VHQIYVYQAHAMKTAPNGMTCMYGKILMSDSVH
jgi:hypothetical protein